MPTPPRPAAKRARYDSSPPGATPQAPHTAPYKRRLAPSLTKPFKSPLKTLPNGQNSASPQAQRAGRTATPARGGGHGSGLTPAEVARRRALRADIAVLEQALRVLGVSVPPEQGGSASGGEHGTGDTAKNEHENEDEHTQQSQSTQSSQSPTKSQRQSQSYTASDISHTPKREHTHVLAPSLSHPRGIVHLEDLTHRWMLAARGAADALLEDVGERVRDMGGLAAWKRRERERAAASPGPTEEEQAANMSGAGVASAEAITEMSTLERREAARMREDALREATEAEKASRDDAAERSRSEETSGGGKPRPAREDDEDEDELTMGAMLSMLHVDPRMLGWNEAEQTWL